MAQTIDIYSRVTNKIIADLEAGTPTWIKPWHAAHTAGRITRPLRHNGQAYSGINILALWASAVEQRFAAPIWMTFRQAKELGAHVRKGERGSQVVYADTLVKTERDEATGEELACAIPFMKTYTVFNVEQIEDLPEHYYGKPEPRTGGPERIERADAFFAATGVPVITGGDEASYNVALDRIRMPIIEAFRDAESYYPT